VDDLYRKYASATNLGEAYAFFTALAEKNPEAQYFRGKILETCSVFAAGPILERLEDRINKSQPSPERISTLTALKASCKDVPVQSVKEGSSGVIRQAAERGDEKAQAFLFRFEPVGLGEKSLADTGQVRSLALSLDPVTINNLDGYFEVRNNLLVWKIPGIEEPVSGLEVANAIRLSACAMGYDCSANSVDAQVTCAYRGFCDGDRISQIKNNLTSPAGFARSEQFGT